MEPHAQNGTSCPTTPSFSSSLADKPSSTLATPATPSPANLIFSQRIRSLARREGELDFSPLLAGRPPDAPGLHRWEREASTTPEAPPPGSRDVFAGRWPSALGRPEQEGEPEPEPLQIIVSPTRSRSASPTAGATAALSDADDLPGRSWSPVADPPPLVEADLYSSIRSTTSSTAPSLSRFTGSAAAAGHFKARPAPPTTCAPEHRVRQSRASLLRAGVDPDAQTASDGSGKGVEHVPTDFTAVPGHKRSRSNLKLDVASIREPAISPRENRASLIRQGKPPPASALRRLPSDAALANAALFAHTPGHRRAESIAVASTLPPAVAPRQTRASSLRAKDDDAVRAHAALEKERAAQRAERVKAEDERKKERRRSTVGLPLASLRATVGVPRTSAMGALAASEAPSRASLSGSLSRSSSAASVPTAGHVVDPDAVSSDPSSTSGRRQVTSHASSDSVTSATAPLPLAPVVPSLASLQAPSNPVRQTRSALLRSGAQPALTPQAPERTKKTKEEIFANVPGHKRRQSIQVLSTTSAPDIAPRQNRAALLRSSMMAFKADLDAERRPAAGTATATPAPPARPPLRPTSAAAGSFSRASALRPSTSTLPRSGAVAASSATHAPPPSSFRSSTGPTRPGSATPSTSRPSSRAVAEQPSRPPSSAAAAPPTIAPRENRAAKLRRLKRASVAF